MNQLYEVNVNDTRNANILCERRNSGGRGKNSGSAV